jgi:competence ComEA-like helix-hairpin-helix protein
MGARALILAVVLAAAAPLQINHASQSDLEGMGMSASQAAQIIRYRNENGPFLQVEELLAVPQISRVVFDRIRSQITVEDGTVPPPPPIAIDVRAAAAAVAIEQPRTEWQNIYGAIVYAATAALTNTGSTPIRAVRVRLDLLDKDGRPVAHTEGFNLAAERLTTAPGTRDTVKPIPAGGGDPLRLSLDKSEIERPFRSARITVVEVLH